MRNWNWKRLSLKITEEKVNIAIYNINFKNLTFTMNILRNNVIIFRKITRVKVLIQFVEGKREREKGKTDGERELGKEKGEEGRE